VLFDVTVAWHRSREQKEDEMSDYVKPNEVLIDALQAAQTKSRLPVRDLLIRGFLAGALLGFATALALFANAQGLPTIVGAILFPVGFVMLVLLGLELATGNFALLPQGLMAGKADWKGLGKNLAWVYLGNLMGCVAFAGLFYLAVTS